MTRRRAVRRLKCHINPLDRLSNETAADGVTSLETVRVQVGPNIKAPTNLREVPFQEPNRRRASIQYLSIWNVYNNVVDEQLEVMQPLNRPNPVHLLARLAQLSSH